jgi:hypothetical protein
MKNGDGNYFRALRSHKNGFAIGGCAKFGMNQNITRMIFLSLVGMILFYTLFFYAIMKLHHVKKYPEQPVKFSL